MSVDLIAAALILVFAAVVVLGHLLVIAAIYRIMREDRAGGGRKSSSATTTADDVVKRAAGTANVSESGEPQHAPDFAARWLLRSARPREGQPATQPSRGPRCGDPGLRTAAERT
jgi:hypothetical protein